MEKIRNYIGGIFTTPYNSNYFNDHNPATGEVYTMIPDSTADDVEIAVQAAKKAFPIWSNMPAEDRSNWLMKVADKGLIMPPKSTWFEPKPRDGFVVKRFNE